VPKARWGVGAALAAGLLLGGCQLPTFGANRGTTTQGQDAFKLWQGFFISGAIVFLLVLGLIVWAAFRYRRRSDEMPRQFQYQTAFEILYTVIPIAIVLGLFAFTFATENEVDTVAAPAMQVNVTAFQWGWQFQYPQYKGVQVIGVETANPTMELPVGRTTHIFLRSKDVIHGFYVPTFNFSRYAQPGILNQFDLSPTETGTFRGQCTQFCGLYHAYMIFQVKVVSTSQFQAWVRQQQRTPPSFDSITAAKAQIAKGTLK
jgi:cytochrome c oxidase subunit II